MSRLPEMLALILICILLTPGCCRPFRPSHQRSWSHAQHQGSFDRPQFSSSSSPKSSGNTNKSTFKQTLTFWALVAIGVGLGWFTVKRRKFNKVKAIFCKQLDAFEAKNSQPCTLPQKNQLNCLQSMRRRQYVLEIQRKDRGQHQTLNFEIDSQEKIAEGMYEVSFIGSTQKRSQIIFRGLMQLRQNQLSMKFAKTSQGGTINEEQAWKLQGLMFYEGKGTLQRVQGKEYYVNLQGVLTPFGSWQLISK